MFFCKIYSCKLSSMWSSHLVTIYCSKEFGMLHSNVCNYLPTLCKLWRNSKLVLYCSKIIAQGWNRCTSEILNCWQMIKYAKLLVYILKCLSLHNNINSWTVKKRWKIIWFFLLDRVADPPLDILLAKSTNLKRKKNLTLLCSNLLTNHANSR